MRKIGTKVIGALGCAVLALGVAFAVPTTAHAATTRYVDGPSEVDSVWGKAYMSIINGYMDKEEVLSNMDKPNILISYRDEGKNVALKGSTNGYTIHGTGVDGKKFAADATSFKGIRGTYQWAFSNTSGFGVGYPSTFVVAAKGEGVLSMSQSFFTTEDAGQIASAVKLSYNTNTNSVNGVTYTYKGTMLTGMEYNSNVPPTVPGTYTVQAHVPADKAQYFTAYDSNEVTFTVMDLDFGPDPGGNSGNSNGGNSGGNSGGNTGGGNTGGGGSGGGGNSGTDSENAGDGYGFSILI